MRRMRHLSVREQVNYLNSAEGPLCLLRRSREFRALQQVHRAVERYWRKMLEQSELGTPRYDGTHFSGSSTVAATSAKAVFPYRTCKLSHAVNHLLTSLVREIRTLGSVGAGGGRPPPATRWASSDPRPYCDRYVSILSRFPAKYDAARHRSNTPDAGGSPNSRCIRTSIYV